MSVIFAYIDDAGNYEKERCDDFVKRNPYYLRACVCVPAGSARSLTDHRQKFCASIGVDDYCELKWQHLWKLKRRDEKGQRITLGQAEQFLKKVKYADALNYATDYLRLLAEFDCSTLITVTPLEVMTEKVDPVKLEKMHLQSIMQRVNFDAKDSQQIAAMFVDNPSDRKLSQRLAEAYTALVRGGDAYSKFNWVHDTVGFHDSRHSAGLQMADFVAGASHNALRGFDESVSLFKNHVGPRLRCSNDGKVEGYGIIEVPTRPDCRQHLLGRLQACLEKPGNDDEIPF